VYSAGLPALILGRLSRARVVVTEHYTGFVRGRITGFDLLTARLAFRYADLVAPVSANLARAIEAIEPRARVRVVENVVDTDVFHPAPEPLGAPTEGRPARLLTVAALATKKGHRYLLEALGALRAGNGRHDVTLELVGDGEERGRLEELARDLDLGEAVRFYGEQPKERVAELMREADLFVLPSLYENLPCSLIEATASGLRCVATAVGGVGEIIDNDGAGILCRPGDAQALAGAISSALERIPPPDPAALAARARERFGYEAFARTWTRLYTEL
jgi:glycosyltransferase involved in cell wall biosynthesis